MRKSETVFDDAPFWIRDLAWVAPRYRLLATGERRDEEESDAVWEFADGKLRPILDLGRDFGRARRRCSGSPTRSGSPPGTTRSGLLRGFRYRRPAGRRGTIRAGLTFRARGETGAGGGLAETLGRFGMVIVLD